MLVPEDETMTPREEFEAALSSCIQATIGFKDVGDALEWRQKVLALHAAAIERAEDEHRFAVESMNAEKRAIARAENAERERDALKDEHADERVFPPSERDRGMMEAIARGATAHHLRLPHPTLADCEYEARGPAVFYHSAGREQHIVTFKSAAGSAGWYWAQRFIKGLAERDALATKYATRELLEAWGRNVCEYAAKELVELRAERDELRETLTPFALFASAVRGTRPQDDVVTYRQQGLRANAFYAAQAALAVEGK